MKRIALSLCLCLASPLFAAGPVQTSEVVVDGVRPVVTEFISANPVEERQFSGVIRGEDVAALAFQTSGRLAAMNVEAGDRIKAGQGLATLDQITLAQDVTVAEAALSSAEAQAEFAQTQYDRVAALLARNVATTAQIEAARAARDAALAQAESARADLVRAREAAGYGQLIAPRDGIVLNTNVEPGTMISPGVSVMEIADPTGREAIIDVAESFAMIIPAHGRFTVYHRAEGVAPVEAELNVIEPVAETSLDTRRLRLILIDPPKDYRIGTLITASYNSDAAPVMTLPQSAILTQKRPGVWRITTEGEKRIAHFTPVTLGAEVGGRIVITEGLAEGDEIITHGVHGLEDGQEVGERLQ
ncbi:efflux RND transporter periplasmic adaptor subunit [uncultured Celeribacter sp.]|uniref:efflux RND transporter periplasmic adaptor subunit n=1 Tax=uncultured Celeribacter sp. TaxID=1303376 RepID=UPI002AA774C8|nr:efflux RND transporter periplasmic adaptor subunit [uncultured Celeribacter sp.]